MATTVKPLLQEKYNKDLFQTMFTSYSQSMNQVIFKLYGENKSHYKRVLANINPRYDWAWLMPADSIKVMTKDSINNVDVW